MRRADTCCESSLPPIIECTSCGLVLAVCHLHIGEDGKPRCFSCFSVLPAEPCEFAPVHIVKYASTSAFKQRLAVVILHGLHVCGAARKCLDVITQYTENSFRVVVIAVGGGGQWFTRFRDHADEIILLRRPTDGLPDHLLATITKATIAEAHYQPAIRWALKNLPVSIPLKIAFHTQPLGIFDDVSLLSHILSRDVMIQVPTEDLKRAYAALLSGDQRDQFIRHTIVCPNALPMSFCSSLSNDYPQLREYGFPGRKVGIVTRLDSDKLSVPLLLNTIKEVAIKEPTISVAIAGPGEDSDEVKKAVRNSGLSRYIKLLGYVDQIEAVYRWADVLFLPSWTEVMPYAVLEAAFFKKTTVMPAIGECVRSLPDKYIRTFPPLDHIAAASMLVGLLQKKSQHETRTNDKDRIRTFHI